MSYPFHSWVYRRPFDYRAPRPFAVPIFDAAVGQVGIPFAMVGGNPDTWQDELGGTSDAAIIDSIDEGEPFVTSDFAESPA